MSDPDLLAAAFGTNVPAILATIRTALELAEKDGHAMTDAWTVEAIWADLGFAGFLKEEP